MVSQGDPTTPLNAPTPLYAALDPGSIGLGFTSAPNDEVQIDIHYLTETPDALGAASACWGRVWAEEGIQCPLRFAGPGVIQINSARTKGTSILWFRLRAAMGHAVDLWSIEATPLADASTSPDRRCRGRR